MRAALLSSVLFCLLSPSFPSGVSKLSREIRRSAPLGGLLETPPRHSVTRISLDKLKSQTKSVRSLSNSTRLSVERAFDSLLDVCTSDAVVTESLHQAFETLNVMKSCGVKLSKSAYRTVINACIDSIAGNQPPFHPLLNSSPGHAKHTDHEQHMMLKKKKSPQHLSSLVASCAINSVRCEALDIALETLSAMHNHSIPLDHTDFSPLFKAIEVFAGNAGALQEGIRSMRTMLDMGHSPDAIVCNALVDITSCGLD